MTTKTDINIRGMICRSCVEEAEAALIQTRGVIAAKVNYLRASARVEYDPAITDTGKMAESLRLAGYSCGKRSRKEWLFDGFCAALVLILTLFLLSLGASSGGTDDKLSYGAAFLLGLVTSPHCICMCGGILLGQTVRRPSPVLAAASYNLGRTVSYTLIGAIIGALGRALAYTQSVKSMVFTMAGLAVCLIGLNLWGLLPSVSALFGTSQNPCALPKNIGSRLAGMPLLIGLATGLMPCGALYAVWMQAAAAGSAMGGGLIMLCFALGTVPLLLVFGAWGALFPKSLNRYMTKLGAVLVLSMGLKMLINGLRLI